MNPCKEGPSSQNDGIKRQIKLPDRVQPLGSHTTMSGAPSPLKLNTVRRKYGDSGGVTAASSPGPLPNSMLNVTVVLAGSGKCATSGMYIKSTLSPSFTKKPSFSECTWC